MKSFAVGALGLCLAACPTSGVRPGPGVGNNTPTLADDLAQLTIPAGSGTRPALDRLDARAETGEMAAAWGRLHYLVDLFDDARFRRNDVSLAALTDARHSTGARRGTTSTDAALAFLIVDADRILASDRLHAGAVAARTLLEFDSVPPARREEVFQRMVELKTIARGGGPLADNARLRLFGFCREAFRDAVQAPPAIRAEMISFCLYPLFTSDPDPYFAVDLRVRPPPPRWKDLSDRMISLAAEVGASAGRLAEAGSASGSDWAAFIADASVGFPTPHNPAALGVPTVARAEPFSGAPLYAIGDGRTLGSRDALVERFTRALTADGRGAVAAAMYGQSRADSLYVIAGAVAEAGGARIELAVGYTQMLQVPEGDYWFGRTADGAVSRVGVIPVSLAPMRRAVPAESSGSSPRALDWDPRRAQLGLHLVIEGSRWRLVAPTGRLTEIDTAGDPAADLRKQLARVRRAFPDEDGLVLVLGADATYAALIAAATAARHDAGGRRLFPRLALATGAPVPNQSKLDKRIDRRASATVTLNPTTLDPRIPIIRRCYQDILERAPQASGSFRVELTVGVPTIVSGPRNKQLRACVLAGVAAPMSKQTIASATATLSTN